MKGRSSGSGRGMRGNKGGGSEDTVLELGRIVMLLGERFAM